MNAKGLDRNSASHLEGGATQCRQGSNRQGTCSFQPISKVAGVEAAAVESKDPVDQGATSFAGSPDGSPGTPHAAYWIEENWCDQARHALKVVNWLHDEHSPYQHIQVVDTQVYGRVLVLDGIFQTSERDEYFYHEMLVHPALCTAPVIERVLIIGGGDGGTAREVLRHDAVREVVMVEIDERVVSVAQQYLGGIGTAFSDSRLDLRICDGVQYLRDAPDASFDVVILDGSDPVGPSVGLFGTEFYRQCQRVLIADGVLALQSESFFQTHELWHDIQRALKEVFAQVDPYLGMVPLYGTGTWSWTLCSRDLDPLRVIEQRASAVEEHTRYYHQAIHRAAFALPNELRVNGTT